MVYREALREKLRKIHHCHLFLRNHIRELIAVISIWEITISVSKDLLLLLQGLDKLCHSGTLKIDLKNLHIREAAVKKNMLLLLRTPMEVFLENQLAQDQSQELSIVLIRSRVLVCLARRSFKQ